MRVMKHMLPMKCKQSDGAGAIVDVEGEWIGLKWRPNATISWINCIVKITMKTRLQNFHPISCNTRIPTEQQFQDRIV